MQGRGSIWSRESLPACSVLAADARADVCIVGAGIAGLSTACLLVREGRSVIVLDDGPVGGGETERSTGHLVNALDDRYHELERLFGIEGARLAAQSHTRAIDGIEELIRDEGIDARFERLDGYLFAPDARDEILLEEQAAARRAGLSDVEMVAHVPLAGFDAGPALRFPRQAQFDPLRYLAGLAAAILRRGGRIHTGSHASEVQGGERPRVATSAGPVVDAGAVVVATNSPMVDRVAIHTKQAAYRTFVVAGRVSRGSIPRALYWDLCEEPGACRPGAPYHYVRLAADPADPGQELLLVGGRDHKTGQADDAEQRFADLESWARSRFALESVTARWSGQVLEPVDSLAFIGRDPSIRSGVYIATGDSGNGLTHGTIAGILLADLIHGRENPWAALYDPARKPVRALGDFARENLDVVRQLGQWLKPGEGLEVAEVLPGQGAVLRRGLAKVAVHRDAEGVLHERSAVCPHLGCLVVWNSWEGSWDCPCHGSRFDAAGSVLNGPANRELRRLGEPEAGDPSSSTEV